LFRLLESVNSASDVHWRANICPLFLLARRHGHARL
jgi:hypothetical protein